MSKAHAQRLKLRLFLEGIEVPVISANVQVAPNSPIVASIQVPPLPEGTRLLPRTIVHLFFLDSFHVSNPLITTNLDSSRSEQGSMLSPTLGERAHKAGDEEDYTNVSRSELSTDIISEQYKVLFAGEVVGFQWTKSQANRSLVLQCEDFSNYWDYAYQWNNTGIFGPGAKALFSGGSSNLFTDFLSSKSEEIIKLVAGGRCGSFPKLKGLAAGIIRLVEAIGGFYFPRAVSGKPLKKWQGQNKFFSLAELRLHITHMIVAYDDDPTSSRLLRRGGFSSMFSRTLNGLGGQVSIRQSINALTQIIFHETYGQPCPMFVPGTDSTALVQSRVNYADLPGAAPLLSDVARAISALVPMQEAMEHVRVVADISDDDSDVRDLIRNVSKSLMGIAALLSKRAWVGGGHTTPKEVSGALTQASHILKSANYALPGWTVSGPENRRTKVYKKISSAITKLESVSNVSVMAASLTTRDPARLNAHILRPDIWFGAPPRCNVIFPDMYDSLSYQRMFLREPTRLLLKTNDEFFGESMFFDKLYFAPQAGSIKRDKARMIDVRRGDLLDHELFTGILPVFEKMGEFNVFARATGGSKHPKVGLAQRTTNFIYFKHRFNARQMSVSCRFNPYIACGFPGLIIDKYVDKDTIDRHNELLESINGGRSKDQQIRPRELSESLGTNFLGNFTQVTHNVSNGDAMGRTEIACSYPRQPEESSEFLGTTEKIQTIRRKLPTTATRATDIAATVTPKVGSLGPHRGVITAVHEVTKQSSSVKLPVFQQSATPSRGKKAVLRVPIGVMYDTTSAPEGQQIAEILGEDATVVFRAYRVEEDIAKFRTEEVDLPAEEYIRPGWYGDIWKTGNIGKVYSYFFGTGAITDRHTVADVNTGANPADGAIGNIGREKQEALDDAALAESPDDPRAQAPAVVELDEGASIQDATDFLVLTYSHIKQNSLDVDAFVSSYTWRPVATMLDMFGTSDLEFSQPDGETVVKGYEGFHSRAFGPYDNVFGLSGPSLEDLMGIKRGDPSAARADPRGRRHIQVQKYVAALKFSRAIIG